ncbi:hypothetical protein E2C01_034886 [Portunus trituberculatus]|uniref:Uncharacterized protein n=1 Tax=Portunus trituberculatus TaxID=210409 RepID=A0A5B7F855_PORTR|nr:hypothetical protein [Portunus trituberculatus]
MKLQCSDLGIRACQPCPGGSRRVRHPLHSFLLPFCPSAFIHHQSSIPSLSLRITFPSSSASQHSLFITTTFTSASHALTHIIHPGLPPMLSVSDAVQPYSNALRYVLHFSTTCPAINQQTNRPFEQVINHTNQSTHSIPPQCT